jgi:hypothetical protein
MVKRQPQCGLAFGVNWHRRAKGLSNAESIDFGADSVARSKPRETQNRLYSNFTLRRARQFARHGGPTI